MGDKTTVIAVTRDLFFMPRIQAATTGAGYGVRRVDSREDFKDAYDAGSVGLIFVDLEVDRSIWEGIVREAKAGPGEPPRIVAYGPHVDEALLDSAREAGCDTVLPKGAFVSRLPEIVSGDSE